MTLGEYLLLHAFDVLLGTVAALAFVLAVAALL